MSSGDIAGVRELIATLPDTNALSVQEFRALYEQLGQQFPVPDGVSVEKTEAGGVSGEWLRAPEARADAVILYVHGGGYMIGSTTSHRHMNAALSQAAGVSVLALDYRLGPENPFPAAVDDAVSAYQWLLRQDIAPGRIAIAGDSAGGGLTVATLVALGERGLPLPASGVCISPWVDLTMTAASYTTKAAADPIVTREGVMRMAQAYLNDQDARTPLASPLFASLGGLPPLLIQVGTDEVLLDDSLGLEKRAKEAGVAVTLEVWDEMIHVWHYFFPMLREGREALAHVGDFVRTGMGLA
ncbi:MAG TPA: alpha/beta hydrolase [Blastocatellia bacterium]|nr:alpha/beta hydrolase [Blastocatellia bacterium]